MNFRAYLVILLLALSSCISFTSYAQNHDHEEGEIHGAEDKRHNHEHHKNELSIAVGAVPLVEEDETALGLHLHYIRGVGESNR
ncbi:MAG: hypothetical protein COB85_03875 [Bacteroidetes bacterium]|nr:MAG: hypothetical protein COB85_03875 [Bacteroidota bacterium]